MGFDRRRGGEETRRPLRLDAGINLFDTSDVYSDGLSEEIFGQAIRGQRSELLISTKATFRFGMGPNDVVLPAIT